MAKRVTIADLAKAADVSISTVDRMLNKRGPVKRVTAEQVLAVAEKIGFYGLPGLRRRLTEDAPQRTFGFLLNGRDRYLYGWMANLLTLATMNSSRIRGRAIVHHIDDLDPEATATALRKLGKECDAVAGVCVNDPQINMVVAELAAQGKPFWSMLSDISAPERAGFIGADGQRIGRSAGWFMSRLRPAGGKIAVLVGSDRYLCQQQYEASFAEYLRVTGCPFELLPSLRTHENDKTASKITTDLLNRHPDLAGIFMAGGGVDGIVDALKNFPDRKITLISTEISESTHLDLVNGHVDVALSHPLREVAEQTIRALEASTSTAEHSGPIAHTVPVKIAISENF